MLIGRLVAMLWVAFSISWLVAAPWSSPTERHVGWAAETPYRVVLVLGAALFLVPAHGYHGWMRLWRPSFGLSWTCLVVMAAGIRPNVETSAASVTIAQRSHVFFLVCGSEFAYRF